MGQFLANSPLKNGHLLAKNMEANFEQLWVNFGQFMQKKMAIFSRQKKEANFWTILGQFLANLFRKKNGHFLGKKPWRQAKFGLFFGLASEKKMLFYFWSFLGHF